MGKRAEVTSPNEEGLQEENPEFVLTGPRSEYKAQHESRITPQELYNISPFLRKWVSL